MLTFLQKPAYHLCGREKIKAKHTNICFFSSTSSTFWFVTNKTDKANRFVALFYVDNDLFLSQIRARYISFAMQLCVEMFLYRCIAKEIYIAWICKKKMSLFLQKRMTNRLALSVLFVVNQKFDEIEEKADDHVRCTFIFSFCTNGKLVSTKC